MSIRSRTAEFCDRFGLRVPILLAPMAGVGAPALSIAVAGAGGLGACGALLMTRPEILDWSRDVRAVCDRFQINLWIPDPVPLRNATQEQLVREFSEHWGPAESMTASKLPVIPDLIAVLAITKRLDMNPGARLMQRETARRGLM